MLPAVSDPDDDPLAPIMAALILGTLVAFAVGFVLFVGNTVSPARLGRIAMWASPFYAAAWVTLLLARWLGARKRR